MAGEWMVIPPSMFICMLIIGFDPYPWIGFDHLTYCDSADAPDAAAHDDHDDPSPHHPPPHHYDLMNLLQPWSIFGTPPKQ